MFDADDRYPYLEENNTMNMDPEFSVVGGVEGLVDWMTKHRAGQETTYWGWDPDGNRFEIQWPLPEDLSYPTTSPLYTAADGGFPVGDLNWFPDKKAEWEAWVSTGVSHKPGSTVPVDFTLEQNYPNPFNPETTIEYHLKSSARVTLTIYNMLGQAVRRLVDGRQVAGVYRVKWDATDDLGQQLPSGIYHYKLDVDGRSLVEKMVLMR